MSGVWTAERVLALAPDAASAKAGQGLGSAKHWVSLGRAENLLWGECQGSGKSPYQTKVDCDEPASSCSCPSRKFPCKHALGLMLVWANNPASLAESAMPAWVVSWKENREKKTEAKKEKTERPAAPVDATALTKRETARLARVSGGLDDLDLWICDLLRHGFVSLATKSGNSWDEQARRMIDAQAPGLARRLRQIDDMHLAGENWQASLLDRLSRLHLLIEGFRHRETLPAEVVEELRVHIGFPSDLDAVRTGPGVRDRWQVLGHAFGVDDKVSVRRTWLVGTETGRPALLLDFAAGARPHEPGLAAGTILDADLGFFPGLMPLRALVKERHETLEILEIPDGGTTIADAFAAFGSALAQSPWLELYPLILSDVQLREDAGAWSVQDASGHVVPLLKSFQRGWELLALCGGAPIAIAGEFDGARLNTLACWIDGRFLSLTAQAKEVPAAWPNAATAMTPLLSEAAASATVGVDRKPPPNLPSGDPIADALTGCESKEAPAKLLAVAAAASLYGRVGKRPRHDPAVLDVCPPETVAECSRESLGHFLKILEVKDGVLLREWLGLLANSGRRLPHDQILGLIEWQRTTSHQAAIAELTPRVIGVRGHWLAGRNRQWREFRGIDETDDPAAVWETGTRQERLAALNLVRGKDAERGRELLASTFAKEPAADRKEFLETLRVNLSMADEPFLESTLDDRSSEVRKLAADLLSRLAESRLTSRMIERAKTILTWDGGLVVTPPSACDKAMIRDGMTAKPVNHAQYGPKSVSLQEILFVVPPAAVSKFLGRSPGELLKAAETGDWKESLRDCWAAAVRLHPDGDWVEAIIAAYPPAASSWARGSDYEAMFQLLPQERQDALMSGLIASTTGPFRLGFHPAAALVGSMSRPMSVSISREILARVRDLLDDERRIFSDPERAKNLLHTGRRLVDQKYHGPSTQAMIEDLADAIPLKLTDEAAADFPLDDETHFSYACSYANMLNRMRFRRDMHKEFDL